MQLGCNYDAMRMQSRCKYDAIQTQQDTNMMQIGCKYDAEPRPKAGAQSPSAAGSASEAPTTPEAGTKSSSKKPHISQRKAHRELLFQMRAERYAFAEAVRNRSVNELTGGKT